MNDPLDVSLCDHELLAELEMMTNLIIAASEAEGVLTQPVMDRVLGLEPGLVDVVRHDPRGDRRVPADLSRTGTWAPCPRVHVRMRDEEGLSARGRQPATGTSSPSRGGEELVVREAVVQQAIGILMHRLDLSFEKACELLRMSARRANVDAAELARTLVDELDRQSSSAPGEHEAPLANEQPELD